MKGRHLDILFDWKAMGVSAYIPLIVVFLLIVYSSIFKNVSSYIVPALESTFPIFGGWWSIFLFQDILEEHGSETFFSYPVSRWNLGITRIFVYFLLYMFLLSFMLILIDQWLPGNNFVSLFTQLVTQSFFFSSLGFLSMVLTNNSGWSLVILIVYSSTQILTRGALFPLLNIYLFNQRVLPLSELISPVVYTLMLSIIFFVIAHKLFGKFQFIKDLKT